MKLYHGSDHKILSPIFNFKSITNDYGYGFYMTEDIELAKEWATNNHTNKGVVNIYELNINNLKILDLTKEKYSSLNWLALLVSNRNMRYSSLMMKNASDYLINNYLIDINNYDIVIGYRADDSYFAFVKSFLRNEMTLEELDVAIRLGNLGKQYFIKSKTAFEALVYVESQNVDYNLYSNKKKIREQKAINKYRKLISNPTKNRGTLIQDLMDGKNNEHI